jgi:hypothetical protein
MSTYKACEEAHAFDPSNESKSFIEGGLGAPKAEARTSCSIDRNVSAGKEVCRSAIPRG